MRFVPPFWLVGAAMAAAMTFSAVAAPEPGTAPQHDGAEAPPVVTATIELRVVPLVPNPRHNVYPEGVLVTEAEIVQQTADGRTLPGDLLVAFWGFRERELLPAADYEPGTRLEVELIDFAHADPEVQEAQQISESDESDKPLLWAISAEVIPPASPDSSP